MESVLRLGESVRRRPWTVRSSTGGTARSSVRGRGRHARPPVRASTHGFQQSGGDAISRRQASAAGLDGARCRTVAGLAALSLSAVYASNVRLRTTLKTVVFLCSSFTALFCASAGYG